MLKNIFYAVLLGIGMAACLSQQDNQNDDAADEPEEFILPEATDKTNTPLAPDLFVVEKQRVGNTRIGMPIEQMRRQVAAGLRLTDTTLTLEGTQSTAYVLRPEGQPKGLLIEQTCNGDCEVWRISVLSPSYKTAKGIGVGTTYEALQRAYKIRSVSFEEGNLVALPEKPGLSFLLDHRSLSGEELAGINATTVPKNLVVERILVY